MIFFKPFFFFLLVDSDLGSAVAALDAVCSSFAFVFAAGVDDELSVAFEPEVGAVELLAGALVAPFMPTVATASGAGRSAGAFPGAGAASAGAAAG
jgi:hypothetical protein